MSSGGCDPGWVCPMLVTVLRPLGSVVLHRGPWDRPELQQDSRAGCTSLLHSCMEESALCMPKSVQSPPAPLAALAACACQAEPREQRWNVPFPKAAGGSNLK